MRFSYLLPVCIAAACGGAQDNPLLHGDASVATDSSASSDASTPETSTAQDASTTSDSGTQGTDASTTDAAQPPPKIAFHCGNATVTDCSQCANAPQPCVYCNTTNTTQLTGVCTQLHTNCVTIEPQGFGDCPCANDDVSLCPEPYQICNQTNSCHTCSDATGNNGLACEGGGTCNPQTGTCQ